MFNFLWNNKSDKIKREIMFLDYAEGGIRVPKVNTMFKALKLAWIPRLLRDFDCNSEAWRSFQMPISKGTVGLTFCYSVTMIENVLTKVQYLPSTKRFLYTLRNSKRYTAMM